jgi:hypothetical protein
MGGVLRTSIGGIVSFGPPVGDTTMAHLGKNRLKRNANGTISTCRFESIIFAVSGTNL